MITTKAISAKIDADLLHDEQHIICDGHRRWLEGCTEVARAALRGIAALNED